MGFRFGGREFPDNLFDEIAEMDENHDWERYHEYWREEQARRSRVSEQDSGTAGADGQADAGSRP